VDERRPPYGIAIGLIVAGVLPFLARDDAGKFAFDFFQPHPLVANAKPDLAKAVAIYPAAAGLLALLMGWVLPRWMAAFGLIAVGAALPVFLALDGGVMMASWGSLPGITPPWDCVILGGIALTFVATRTLTLTRPWLPLAFLVAAGGAAVLTWLVCPRPHHYCDTWLGLFTQQNPEQVPVLKDIAVARGFMRNADFPNGTHFVWYAWWNVYLVALAAFPLLALRVLVARVDNRTYWSSNALGALWLVLIALMLMPVIREAFSVQLGPPPAIPPADGIVDGLVRAANEVRVVFPPLLLPLLALTGVSDLLGFLIPGRRLG